MQKNGDSTPVPAFGNTLGSRMGFIFIIAGCVAIVLGVRGGKFSIGDPDGMTSFNRESSTRSGRAVFIIAGTLLIAFGLKFLIVGQ
jgi:hypothetical protein